MKFEHLEHFMATLAERGFQLPDGCDHWKVDRNILKSWGMTDAQIAKLRPDLEATEPFEADPE